LTQRVGSDGLADVRLGSKADISIAPTSPSGLTSAIGQKRTPEVTGSVGIYDERNLHREG